ncbi:MAG TPA: hypothetical protein VHC21_01885 [Candidatus Saccharimonadales bacterium]|nr:hypothetical protein [Candidatus Saccharimonadales bacterium]
MFDKTFFSRERFSASEVAEKIRARWGVEYHSAEGLRRALVAEHPELAAPQQPRRQPITAEQRQTALDASRIGENVFNLEAYGERRSEITRESEAVGRQRMENQARLNAQEAYREFDA